MDKWVCNFSRLTSWALEMHFNLTAYTSLKMAGFLFNFHKNVTNLSHIYVILKKTITIGGYKMRKLVIPLLVLFVLSMTSAAFAANNGKDDEHSKHNKQQQQHQEKQNHNQQQHEDQRDYQERHHDWSHSAYNNENWRHSEKQFEGSFPFGWHDPHDRYYGDRVDDDQWVGRFPGLRPYQWRGEGFWYHNKHVTDAMLFYNDSDQLVSVGFMHDGIFIFIRDDGHSYENHDSFFLVWRH